MAPAVHTPAGQVRYAVSGPIAPTHPDLILLHGWCAESASRATLADAFGTRRRVVTVDLRGHGESARIEDDGSMGVGGVRVGELDDAVPKALREVRIQDYAADVRVIIRQAGLRAPVLIGHSMGALVVLAVLAIAGGGLGAPAAGVLLEPSPVVDPAGREFWRSAAQEIDADRSGAWRARFGQSLFLDTDRVARAVTVETMARFRPAVAAGAARAMARFDGEAALRAVTGPLLAIHADTPEPDLARVAAETGLRLTTGQTVGAGHFHHLEVPDQVVPMIQRWLTLTGV